MAWVKTPSGRIISIDNEVAMYVVNNLYAFYYTIPLEYQELLHNAKSKFPFPSTVELKKHDITGTDKVLHAFQWHVHEMAPWNTERYLLDCKKNEPAKSGFSSFIKATNG